eukprot:8989165-Pyramimonas_sp.AAC.1
MCTGTAWRYALGMARPIGLRICCTRGCAERPRHAFARHRGNARKPRPSTKRMARAPTYQRAQDMTGPAARGRRAKRRNDNAVAAAAMH